ncbi:MAG: dephospho-CoA kinase [Gammaproteobacteria bacterium]|nr:dephospho-CoA kinase [Gammaproteobacteria bacterium]MCH9764068.1 dephospho-CoA kinase [Gammaproteobacteria bacterium]
MPYVIVLTGTIASGKSTAVEFFKQQSIGTICADSIARELTEPDTPALAAIAAHFGQRILMPDGALDRRALRHVITQHPDEQRWLEAYLHPQIRTAIEAALSTIQSPYAIIEIPLLTQREDFPYLHHVLLLEVDESVQLARLMARDHCTKTEAMNMIQMQPSQTIRRALADDIIYNDGNQEHFKQTLLALHTRYLKAAQAA